MREAWSKSSMYGPKGVYGGGAFTCGRGGGGGSGSFPSDGGGGSGGFPFGGGGVDDGGLGGGASGFLGGGFGRITEKSMFRILWGLLLNFNSFLIF